MPSQRQLRIGELLRHALAEEIGRGAVRDPDIEGVAVTVTEVRVSPDLKSAVAFLMPLGGGEAARAVAAFNRSAGFLRGRLARSLSLKFTPSIEFRADPSFDRATHIEELLRSDRVARDVRPRSGTESGNDDGA